MANPYKDQQRAAKEQQPKVDRLLIEPRLGERLPKHAPIEASNDRHPVWVLKKMDLDGPWGWRSIPKGDLWELHERLAALETMVWGKIDNCRDKVAHRLFHRMPVDVISSEAQKRLRAIGRRDVAELHRFLIKGKVRLWGVRVYNVFEVLWYDPDHLVYPTEPRNT